jgi:hypothetical protein
MCLLNLVLLVTACSPTPLTQSSDQESEDVGSAADAGNVVATERPTPSPQATPIPDELVWFGPNMGSLDFVNIFTDPQAWLEARPQIDVLRFHSSVLFSTPCSICGDNYLTPFVEADAFKKLADWGIAIGIEVGAIYEQGCQGRKNFLRDASVAIGNIQRNGGRVDFLAMDSPLVHGRAKPVAGACNYTLEEAAAETAAFVYEVNQKYPSIVVGDTEPFPHYSVSELKDWILALEENDIRLSFFHLDVDIERVRVEGQDVSAALQELRRFCEEHGITFGVIFTSNWTQAFSNRSYYLSTMAWIETVREAIGRPDHIVFESWQGPSASGYHEVPINLPTNDPDGYSHIDLLIDGLTALAN